MSELKYLMNLSGRRALITGAAGNLGRVMADSLAELGADLILVDIDIGSVTALADHLMSKHSTIATAIACDLEQASQRAELANTVLDSSASLSILVNNAAFVGTAGLTGWAEPFEGQCLESWRRAIEVNLTAVFHLSQLFAPSLRVGPGGTVVNIASIYGQLGPDWSLYEGTSMSNPAAYGASKGGLIQLTRWLATTLGPGVRCNVISPGGSARGQPDLFVDRYKNRTPLARMATEDDFRGAIAYLASDLSAYVTGHVLSVDGGWSAW
jgi:NAD(P)-dependent dehydrogenase (short-subunit alcohol dehydrogenase family)